MKTRKKIVRISIIALKLVFIMNLAGGQELTQTIRGTILDQDSKTPLIGTNIFIPETNPVLGASSDLDGSFRITNVPVGRVNLNVTYLGYEDKIISNILVGAGKEVVLNIELTESVLELNAIEIKAKKDKTETRNDMAAVSSRSLSIEESKRYAGSINDPARLVSGFAGVTGNPEGNNDIVVRGNSPRGILWRLEGIEIPNPNHFASEGTSGGPINALNSEMLANSDFYTGAFAPEYGNALSGVFDMKLRTGNNEKREYLFSAGLLGTDFTAEGPFKKGSTASYLVNYRYATLSLLDQFGLVDFQGVPKYQDASFKVVVPTQSYGIFSVFGLGGLSHIDQEDIDEDDEEIIYSKLGFEADLGVMGLTNTYMFNDKTYLKNTVSISSSKQTGLLEELEQNNNTYRKDEKREYSKNVFKYSATLNNKFNAKNRLQSGFTYSNLSYRLFAEDSDNPQNQLITEIDVSGNASTLEAYTS